MRLRDVRAETDRGDLGRIGVTALLEDGEHTLVHFGLRNWPDDGSAHHLEWTVSDSNNETELAGAGGGFGGGVSPDRLVAFDGGWWFQGVVDGELRVRCVLGTDLLLDVLVGDRLNEVSSGITGVEQLEGSDAEHRSIAEALTAAGWRTGKAVADDFVALTPQAARVGRLEVVPISIERWDQLLRITVAMTGANQRDDPPRWWSVRFGHRNVQALCESAQSGRTADLIGHLVMMDPMPHRALHQIGS